MNLRNSEIDVQWVVYLFRGKFRLSDNFALDFRINVLIHILTIKTTN